MLCPLQLRLRIRYVNVMICAVSAKLGAVTSHDHKKLLNEFNKTCTFTVPVRLERFSRKMSFGQC